jgi:hypothetical protein
LSKDIWMHKGIRPNAYPIIRIPKAVECFYYLVNEADFFHKLIINGCDFWFKKLNKILTIENKKIILANCILPLRIWYAERYGLMNLMEHIINEGSKYDAENNKLIEKACQDLNLDIKSLNLIQAQGVLSLIKKGMIRSDFGKNMIT